MIPMAASAQLNCKCDVTQPETLKARECSLCTEAEKQPADLPVILVKDINPRKPNRWLALPRVHASGPHRLEDLTAEQRTALWSTAIEKAKGTWGERWAIAMNGELVRTQCHMHVHIGRLLEGVETANFITASSPDQIPLPGQNGVWIHPVLNGGNTFHVHLGEQVTETVLLR
jgi:diadenosine tetraphosphate (Ap4A) HIT family hydrolase